MDFEPINSQEEFDKRIKERIKRETEKFSDYEDLKTQINTLNSQIESLNGEIQGKDSKYNELETKFNESNAKIAKYESDSVKTRIAQEFGLDAGLANRLTGETEEDIRKDAEALKGIVGSTSVQRINYNPESTAKDEENAALKNMLQAMKGE